jgi:hypothetical protein
MASECNLLREPAFFVWDDQRLAESDKELIEKINASVSRLCGLRAVQIIVSGPFARSKIAWKLAVYQHVLLHRMVALMDGTAVAWNSRCTLSAILSARAVMETFAILTDLEQRVGTFLQDGNLSELDSLAQKGIFASRDQEWIKQAPDTAATSVLTYIDKLDKKVPGYRAHYDSLSERCHPNSLGHNFMFSNLDRSDGTVRFCDEREPHRNSQMIFAALASVPWRKR